MRGFRKIPGILPLAILLAWMVLPAIAFSEPTATTNDLQKIVSDTYLASDVRSFRSTKGAELSYFSVNQMKGGEPRPIVISPGKGETAYRYLDLIHELLNKGYGPIYLLEHRGQGGSQRFGPQRHIIHVDDFHTYVDEFIEFMDGPVAGDLASKGIRQKPVLLAHSMGGAVANLALHRRPDLADKIAYIAPMFGINYRSPVLHAFGGKPMDMLVSALCFAKCDLAIGRKPGVPVVPKYVDPLRRNYADELERILGIEATAVTPGWIREAIGATREIMHRAQEQGTASVIFQARHEEVVMNPALFEYSCRAKNCGLVELEGGHALHQGEEKTRLALLEKLDEFYSTGKITAAAPKGCQDAFRLLRYMP